MSKICMIVLEACCCCKEQAQISEADNAEFLLVFAGAIFGTLFLVLFLLWLMDK